MQGFPLVVFLLLFFFQHRSSEAAAAGASVHQQKPDAKTNALYIVYMGAAARHKGTLRLDQLHLINALSRILKRNVVVRNFKYGFSGFTARMTKQDAKYVARQPGVVSVFPDSVLKLHTTRSWDFLEYQTHLIIDSPPTLKSSQSNGTDTIIGILDTGIWPESQSFSDEYMGPIPSRWKGICVSGTDFNPSNCNKKLIGARYYTDDDDGKSVRDSIGHGTHVASTAAGASTPNASFYGLGTGTAKGGSSDSRLAVYKVCSDYGCPASAILAAFDDAINDGVDILSLSLGSAAMSKPDYTTDPIAIGAFHAMEKGITVVCSAGNSGPDDSTVSNEAPWILTVAATTIDRNFQSNVLLGVNKTIIKGEGINLATLEISPVYSLVDGKSAKLNSSTDDDARNCLLNTLDPSKIKGKIVLCYTDEEIYRVGERVQEAQDKGGVGLLLVYDKVVAVAFTFGNDFPTTTITTTSGAEILSYINSTQKPVATILPTETISNYKPAPMVAFFSSRGPSLGTRNLLKPDIAAPGVDILAAWFGNDTSQTPKGKDPPQFNILSGTSMSCPHVSGIAATIKSRYPTWSPSAIRSAIMTTASQTNNLKAPMTTDSGSLANPYDYGAGEISPSRSLDPGLVYETDSTDYLNFLCYNGYIESAIKLIATVIPHGFACPKNLTTEMVSDINYPSIAVSNFDGKQKTVKRTITNVGVEAKTTYIASVEKPSGLNVQVVPNILQFTETKKQLSYQVIFSSMQFSPLNNDAFGSITLADGMYKVRIPFVVSSKGDDK